MTAPVLRRGTDYAVASTEQLVIARIRTDGGTQARANLNQEVVAEYMQAMIDGATFPPIIVYYDGADHWLADGFHRVAAMQQIKLDIAAEIKSGTRRDAVLHAVGANKAHGLRRTRADVQRAINVLLHDPEWQKWSDREIARQVGCHHSTVSAARSGLVTSGEISQIENRTVERNGTTYEQTARQPTPVTSFPEPPPGWRWARGKSIPCQLIGPDGWVTANYNYPDRALAEAQRRILSMPKAQRELPPAPQGYHWKHDGGYCFLVDVNHWSTPACATPQEALQSVAHRTSPPPSGGEVPWLQSVRPAAAESSNNLLVRELSRSLLVTRDSVRMSTAQVRLLDAASRQRLAVDVEELLTALEDLFTALEP